MSPGYHLHYTVLSEYQDSKCTNLAEHVVNLMWVLDKNELF